MVSAGSIYPPTRSLYNGVINTIPGSRGSGILAAKRGYHSSRNYNRAYYPSDYSIRYSIDQLGPGDGAAAIDVSMSTSNMIKYTKILIAAMKRGDPRVQSIKETIGTVDGRNVVRYTRTSRKGSLQWASSDSSHLWHIHLSLFRADVNDWNKLKGIIEVLGGAPATSSPTPTKPSTTTKPSTSTSWEEKLIMSLPTVRKGASGYAVRRVQGLLVAYGGEPSRKVGGSGGVDGQFGPGTDAGVRSFQKSKGLVVDGIVGRNTWTKLVGG